MPGFSCLRFLPCFCAARIPTGNAAKIVASRIRDASNVSKYQTYTSQCFMIPNDILERADCTLIVSAECACYIQSKQRRSGRGNFRTMHRRYAGLLLLCPFLLVFLMTTKARSHSSTLNTGTILANGSAIRSDQESATPN